MKIFDLFMGKVLGKMVLRYTHNLSLTLQDLETSAAEDKEFASKV